MKPDKRVCSYPGCNEQISNRAKYCSDAHRMAHNRNSNKPEQINPNKTQLEQPNPNKLNEPEQTAEQVLGFRLTSTDQSFYDRAMRDFQEPYYRFSDEIREEECIYCGKKFKTGLRMLRYCKYEHYMKRVRND